MVREVAPNLSYHYWYLGVQGINLGEEADPLVMVRGSEFNHEREIEMERCCVHGDRAGFELFNQHFRPADAAYPELGTHDLRAGCVPDFSADPRLCLGRDGLPDQRAGGEPYLRLSLLCH